MIESADMTREQAIATIQAVQEIQAMEDLSDAQVAAAINLSATTWNRAKNGTYAGRIESVGRAAARWIAERGREVVTQPTEYVSTSLTRQMLAVCQAATDRGTIGLIIGPSGVGKTLAVEEYARRLGDKGMLLTGGETCRSRGAMAWELASRLGLRLAAKSGIPTVFRAARERLARMYARGRAQPLTILVDEATRITPEALDLMLRSLFDDRTCRCPLVLAATWDLYAQLHAPRGLPGGFEQLRSRMGMQCLLRADREIPLEDVRAVADSVLRANGGRAPLARMPAKAVAFLHRHVANRPVQIGSRSGLTMRPGALRNVMQRMHNVIDLCRKLRAAPQWSVAELDHVAELVDMPMANPDTPSPFAPAAAGEPSAEPARAAG